MSKYVGRRPRLIVLILILGTILTVGFNLSQTRAQSASDGGTSIPVKKGGTGATTAQEALQNLGVPSFTGNDGKVLGLNSGDLAWVEQAQDYGGMVPDYANMESTNRISTNQGTWVADRTGWVKCDMYSESTASVWNVTVDGKGVFRGATTPGATSVINFPVAEGQTVKLMMETGTFTACGCFFIPPKSVTPPQLNENYPAVGTEIDTGKKWIDGKPIYRQVFDGKITAAADERVTTTLKGVVNVADIVDCGGWIVANTTSMKRNMFPMVSLGSTFIANLTIDLDMTLVLGTSYTGERTNAPYVIWVEYTKTTD